MEHNYDIEIKDMTQHLFDVMAARVSAEDMARIKDALAFAHEAHKEQKRKTGAPYIIHPIAVATIAAEELKLDADSVITAFLHDVVEDTLQRISARDLAIRSPSSLTLSPRRRKPSTTPQNRWTTISNCLTLYTTTSEPSW